MDTIADRIRNLREAGVIAMLAGPAATGSILPVVPGVFWSPLRGLAKVAVI